MTDAVDIDITEDEAMILVDLITEELDNADSVRSESEKNLLVSLREKLLGAS